MIVTGLTRSLAVAWPGFTIAPFGPVASAVTFAGALIGGGCVSTTVMVKLAVAVLPALSTAVQRTMVFRQRECGLTAHRTTRMPAPEPESVRSRRVEQSPDAPAGLVASAVRSVDTVRTGAIASRGSKRSVIVRSSPDWTLKSACVGVTVYPAGAVNNR